MSNTAFPRLFAPIAIRGVPLRNRIAVSAHFAGWWVTDGLPNERFAAYVEQRARSGVGLFVIGATGPTYDGSGGFIHNTSDAIIPRYRILVEAAHRHGMKIFAQLLHLPDPDPTLGSARLQAGMLAAGAEEARQMPRRVPRTAGEIRHLVERFGEAAARAKAGGVDGLELHAHEGFLHAQTLSPLRNHRTDEYGGLLENRMRFTVETLSAMRRAIGDELPLGVRLKAHDVETGGMTTTDCVEMIRSLERMKLIDYVSLTAGDAAQHHGPMCRADGEWIDLVAEIKRSTRLIVMHAGHITTPEMAEAVLAEGKMDVVCLTKAHIADADFTLKVRENRLDDIRYCTRCLQKCIGDFEHMTCVYNPRVSREIAWRELPPAERRKRIVIVGAGPAGMEAALTAHHRGHEIIVIERSGIVGGQVRVAAASPMRRMFGRVAEFYQRQADKAMFEMRYQTEATRELLVSLKPDAVIIATGSCAFRAALPGGGAIHSIPDALAMPADDAGVRSALVVDRTGRMDALVLCDRLTDTPGTSVYFVTPLAALSPAVELMTRQEMLERLHERGVRFDRQQDIIFWDGKTARVRSNVAAADEREIHSIDLLSISAGASPLNALATELHGLIHEIHTIGDANLPRTVYEATLQGATVGRTI